MHKESDIDLLTRRERTGKINTILLSFVLMMLSGGGAIAWNVMQKTGLLGEDVSGIKIQVQSLVLSQGGNMPRNEIEAKLAGIETQLQQVRAENNECRARLTALEISVARGGR